MLRIVRSFRCDRLRGADFLPQLSMQRMDVQIPARMDKLDGVKYIPTYREYGKRLARTLDVDPLLH